MDVPSSGTPLEHDVGNGEKSIPEGIRWPHMGVANCSHSDCGLRNLCFCSTGCCRLYVSENTVCIHWPLSCGDFETLQPKEETGMKFYFLRIMDERTVIFLDNIAAI